MVPARPLERAAAPLPDDGFARSEEEDGKLPEPRLASLAFGEVAHEPPEQRREGHISKPIDTQHSR